ncbi:uncharacterized protein KY384_005567 [Bacidia gigantensis]|uniref:uncharacterized protein n=1 Tax=Bacidia gigantensis TaxID=2732470 RepID=UPI001D059A73|nr:uncharacterized protein KY384_005567 [Bacidia gigantensis]KAG8530085.1 hypothetical protein KY384_005567 [Bacidia gigantensis]
MGITRALWALPFELACIVLAAQPSAVSPVSAPLRDLSWGQLNFLHTTDTHGWHAGHLQEPSYSADWGDYISFSERLRLKSDKEGKDLLLIDTGDRIEGNGLYDASRPKGKYDLDIFSQQSIDAICSGNHELYKVASIEYEYNTTVPHFEDTYIASNLDIIEDGGAGERKPLAQRFKKFTTKNQGIRILSFGFLFNFNNGAKNIFVQKVEDTIKEKWFQDAIRDRRVDLVLVIGHADLHSPEFEAIYKAIRGQQWDVPIQFFGGHSHIRDFKKFDKKAYGLQSGRYLETVGFMSIDGLNAGGNNKHYSRSSTHLGSNRASSQIAASPSFSRRYIDNNLYSFHHHTTLNASTFPTPHGLNVSAKIRTARKKLNLDDKFGCAPQTYWTNRAPIPSPDSLFTLIQDHIFPDTVATEERKDIPHVVLTNTGAMRFDIFEGPFTIDSMYAVSPFTSGFRFIKDVPFNVAKRLLQILNQEVPQLWPIELAAELKAIAPVPLGNLVSQGDDERSNPASPVGPSRQVPFQAPLDKHDDEDLIPGYTTHDDGGSDGDDTIHSTIKFYNVPNCIESRVAFPATADQKDPRTVDLVYNSFLEKYVLLALKFLGTGFDEESTAPYMEGKSMTQIIGEWVRENWKCKDEDDEKKGDGSLEL